MGAASTVVLGKETVRTPFSNAAFTSVSCVNNVLATFQCFTSINQSIYLHSLRKLKRPGELAKASFAHRVTTFLAVRLLLAFSRHGEYSIEYLDVNVFLLETRQLEGGCHSVRLIVDMKVKPGKGYVRS